MTLTSMAEQVQRHEQDMRRSVQQKDAMLKEIHHRVKNNLQVVTSLMSIQANRLHDEASKRALAELQRRVRALGLLHRHLYEGDDLRYLDFGQFTVELCQMVKESSGPAARAVNIEVDIPPIPITADRAVPLGLLITEALGNAFKHGFPGGRAGEIRIKPQRHGRRCGDGLDRGQWHRAAPRRDQRAEIRSRHRHAADAGLRPAIGQRALGGRSTGHHHWFLLRSDRTRNNSARLKPAKLGTAGPADIVVPCRGRGCLAAVAHPLHSEAGMAKSRFKEALGDVSRIFKTPRAVLEASDLDRQQKIDLLKQWETDLRLLMVASEENMTGNVPGRTAELLRDVLRSLNGLGGGDDQAQPAPTKSGG